MTEDKKRILALAFIAIAVAVYMYSGTFPLGEIGDPGPRVFPRIIAILMGVLGCFQLFLSMKIRTSVVENDNKTNSEIIDLKLTSLKRCGVFLFLIFMLVFAFEWLGAYIATALFLLASFFFLNKSAKNKFLYSTFWSLSFTAAIYLVFEKVFFIPLPAGLFF